MCYHRLSINLSQIYFKAGLFSIYGIIIGVGVTLGFQIMFLAKNPGPENRILDGPIIQFKTFPILLTIHLGCSNLPNIRDLYE